MPFHIFTEPIPSVITVSDHTEIAIAVQKPLQELRLLPDDTWERKRRWKKPAIKKKRRFGFVPVHVNVNAFLCSDTSDSDSKDEDYVDVNANANAIAGHSYGYGQSLRRARKKRNLYDPGVPTSRSTSKSTSMFGTMQKSATARSSKDEDRPVRKGIDVSVLKPISSNVRVSNGKARLNTKAKAKSKSKAKVRSKKTRKRQPQLKVKPFDHRIEELLVYKKDHGNCDVPYTYAPNQSLSNWCSNVRYSYGVAMKGMAPTIKMTEERIQRLRAIGFDFRARSGKSKSNVDANAKAKANALVSIPTTENEQGRDEANNAKVNVKGGGEIEYKLRRSNGRK